MVNVWADVEKEVVMKRGGRGAGSNIYAERGKRSRRD
jgi:hypothetical protein